MAISSLFGRFPLATLAIDTLTTLEITIWPSLPTPWAQKFAYATPHPDAPLDGLPIPNIPKTQTVEYQKFAIHPPWDSAWAMMAENIDAAVIAKCTGLSEEQIRQI